VTLGKSLQSLTLPSFKLPTHFIFEETLRKRCLRKMWSRMPKPV